MSGAAERPLIAGHRFSTDFGAPKCACGMRWVILMTAGREHINELGWAHLGALSTVEYAEIDAERERLWASLRG